MRVPAPHFIRFIAIVLLLFPAACRRPDQTAREPAGDSASSRVTAAKILEIGNGAEPQDLDPHVVTGVSEHNIITALIEVGKIDAAATVLTLAEGPYPRSPDIQKLRAKIETMAELKLETANETRSASKRVEVGSFADFSSEFSQRLKDHGPARALDLIDVARRANPDWFDAESLNVDRMELPLRARGDDPLRLQIIARSVLARAPDEAPRVLKLAEEIRAQNPDHARLLVLEMIRQKTRPDDALARLRQWYPDEFSAEEAKLDTTQAARSSAK